MENIRCRSGAMPACKQECLVGGCCSQRDYYFSDRATAASALSIADRSSMDMDFGSRSSERNIRCILVNCKTARATSLRLICNLHPVTFDGYCCRNVSEHADLNSRSRFQSYCPQYS